MASSQSLESILMCTKSENEEQLQQEKKPKPADEQALKCPRCDSANTKFCYYNNYSLTQPRYFCKSCRRYWTKGGTLRNVPVGGGCRKNKRASYLSKRSTPNYNLQLHHPDHHHHLTTSHDSSYDHSNIYPLALATGAHGGNNGFLLGSGLLGGYPSGNTFLDTLRGGLIEYNNHFLYYGVDNNGHSVNISHDEDNHHEVGMQFDDHNNGHYHHHHHHPQEILSNPSSGSSTPTMKQEKGENRMLWGFPWQLNGEGNYMNGGNHGIDSVKENWNSAIVGSTWNNLLNSPLM